MIILVFIYVLITAMSYCYLMGSAVDKKSFDIRRFMFSAFWPYFALISYMRVIRGWDDKENK